MRAHEREQDIMSSYINERNRYIQYLINPTLIPNISLEEITFDKEVTGLISYSPWMKIDLERAFLVHPRLISWRMHYFNTLGFPVTKDLGEKIAKYEYEVHYNIYPTHLELQGFPELKEKLFYSIHRLKQLEISFIHVGMFFAFGKNFESSLSRLRVDYESRLEHFVAFLEFFYDCIAESELGLCSMMHCCSLIFQCGYTKSEFSQTVDSLKVRHVNRLTVDDMLADFQVLHAGLLSANRIIENNNQELIPGMETSSSPINYQTMDSVLITPVLNTSDSQFIEMQVMGDKQSERTPLLAAAKV